MSGKMVTAASVAAAILFLGVAFQPAPSRADESKAKALFEAKCSICHSLSRPLGEHKDLAGWTKTVTRMQKQNGCPITDQEAKMIIDYLVSVRGPAKK